MKARFAIFKRDSSRLYSSGRLFPLYVGALFTLLLGASFLQRFDPLSIPRSALGGVTLEERRYAAFAERLCHALAPQIDRFQVGLVTESVLKHDSGFISVQLSDVYDKNHFHVLVERDTGELVVFSHVVRKSTPYAPQSFEKEEAETEEAAPCANSQGERKIALETARRSLKTLYEAGAIPFREPLGVTLERRVNWTVQWRYRDCCIVMDIRTREKRMATYRVRQHPRPLAARAARCPYCQGFGKGADPMEGKPHGLYLSSAR